LTPNFILITSATILDEDQLAALQPLQGLRRKTAVFVLISVLRTKKQFVVENLEKFLCKGSKMRDNHRPFHGT